VLGAGRQVLDNWKGNPRRSKQQQPMAKSPLFYEYTALEPALDYDIRFFAQYEGFSEFNDLSHITNLITVGLTMQITRYIAVELGLRAFYETRTKEDTTDSLPGFNQWSVRQDSLFGLTYAY
jgi:hypothetical protein